MSQSLLNGAAVLAATLVLALPAAAQDAKPNDAQIAAIVVTANQVDIDAGKLAAGKTQDKAVRDFANQMITDHTAVNKSATDLVTKLKVKPEPNATADDLKKGGDDNVSKLKALSGKDFDKAYVAHEVAYHQAVIDAMDKTLVPSASNAELKALLVKVRPAFVAHMDHAKSLQSQMAK